MNVVDPTGAGDAYRAGLLTGVLLGWSLDSAGRLGSLAAAYAVEAKGTQEHSYTFDEFKIRFQDTFPDYADDVVKLHGAS